jgi:hypothetical protein
MVQVLILVLVSQVLVLVLVGPVLVLILVLEGSVLVLVLVLVGSVLVNITGSNSTASKMHIQFARGVVSRKCEP